MSGWGLARRGADRLAWTLAGLWGLGARLSTGRPPPLDPSRVERVLAIRLDLLGDLVFAAPALDALRAAFPHARLTLVTLPYTAPLAALLPAVDEVLTLDVNAWRRPAGLRQTGALLTLVRRLRRQHFDLCIAFHGRPAGLLALASGARVRVGYAAHAYPWAFNRPLAGWRYDRRRHEVEYCLDLARAVGADGPGVPRLTLPMAEDGDARAAHCVVLHPGASNGAAKRWGAARWGALGAAITARLGLAVVVTGSDSEAALVQAVVAACGAGAEARVGGTLLELATLLQGATAVVAGDTGPLHLAAALGRPVVGVFGPTDPAHTGPRGARAAVVRRPVACGPCYDLRAPADCRLPDRGTVCMVELAPERVFAALRALLDAQEAEQRAAVSSALTRAD